MTLKEFYTTLNADLKNIESIYKGFVITDLSMPYFEKNSKGVYGNYIYVESGNEKQNIKLKISLSVLEEAKRNGHTINESVSVDITIDSIYIDKKGEFLVTISKVVESGIGEQELFIKNLIAYCNKNGFFDRPKRDYPSLVKKIALISTNNTNTLDDIMKNLNYTAETVSFKVQSTTNAIAEQIRACNTNDYDLILLYRGGHEDKSMNIYSDTPVLNAIHESKIHIGVALGHETDNPFVQNVADSRYSTPTNFAQVINSYNQGSKNIFNKSVLNIKLSIENLKSKLQSTLFGFSNYNNIFPLINKLDSDLHLGLEKVLSNSNKTIHLFDLQLQNRSSNINTRHLKLISKLESNLKSRANNIDNLSSELIYQLSEKKSKKTKIILVSIVVIALAIIIYLLTR